MPDPVRPSGELLPPIQVLTRPASILRLLPLSLLLALPGCSMVTDTAPISQVRIVDTAATSTGLDIYQGSSVLAYNLGLGTVTSYIALTPGAYNINVRAAGTGTQIVSASNTFLKSSQYSVVLGNYSTGLSAMVLKDQSTPAPAAQIALRVLDQSSVAGALDLYLVPSNATITTVKPFLTNVTFNSNSGYLNVPSGTYTLVALPAGTTPTATASTLYSGTSVVYAQGSAKTIYLLDQSLINTPGVQVRTTSDYDPATASS